ncbi:hypothetical protein D6Z43_16350 [Pseudomonas sp. DY-1]|uniref:hypothetical protein n=1 Tax=Pseudomonas sp. DY-1 TaxID=1755504 RepID=UPI000EA8B305|nr:hypothetical protein [Pseudomonas sp. DY-1]AYF88641.1 hypothetical protein D6Z43_16350 [Pseudomonas sp. DY-1]
MKPTSEELILQVVSTCILIGTQGNWIPQLSLMPTYHSLSVYIYPQGYFDLPEVEQERIETARFSAYYTGRGSDLQGEAKQENGRQQLIDLLAWLQDFLSLTGEDAA